MYHYSFFGKVLPERADVNISPLTVDFFHPDTNIKGKLTITIISSQVSALLITNEEVSNVYTLKNIIEDLIRFEVDMLGFLIGCGYDLEITSLITSPNVSTIVFGVGMHKLEQTKQDRLQQFDPFEILQLTSCKTGDYIRRAFSDLREALRVAKDTGFFCYRAIESFKQYFTNEFNIPEKDAWVKLRETLDVHKDEIMFIKSFADSTRHGGNVYISGENREKILEKTWHITGKFIHYAIKLKNNTESL